MTDFLTRFAAELWSILLDTGVWLLVGLALAGVVHALVPRSFMARHLAGRGFWPIAKASLLGIPLPLCSCSVIPVAAGLRGSGASKGASAAFAISTPQTGEESVPLTWALFGPVYALARPVLAVATAFTAGTLIDRLVGEGAKPAGGAPAPSPCGCGAASEPEPTEPPAASCCSSEMDQRAVSLPVAESSCCGSAVPKPEPEAGACCHGGGGDHSGHADSAAPLARKLNQAFTYGFGTLLRDLAPWLAVGLVLSAVIAAAVPAGWIESNVGTGLVPMLLMLVVGLPLYVCATSTTPLAYTLVVAGLSPGAGLVLLLAGPASNMATMSWVVKDLGVRALVIYLLTIAAFAVGGGLAFDALLAGTVSLAEQGGMAEHTSLSVVQGAAAGGLAVLLLWALVERTAGGFAAAARAPQTA